MRETPEFKAFKENKLDRTILIAVGMGICMIMGFHLLDLLLKLDRLRELLATRLAMTGIGITTAALTLVFRKHPRFLRVVPFGLFVCGTVYSAALTHFAGGLSSSYWAGFAFFVVAWCGIFPQSFRTSLVTTFVLIAAYNGLLVALNASAVPAQFVRLVESNVFIVGFALVGFVVSFVSYRNKLITHDARRELEIEKDKVDKLLLNILPAQIADRLKNGETTISDYFDNVAILFADIVGFTKYCSGKSSQEIVELLNTVFYAFDKKTEELGLEKIKTIGDGYMVLAGGLKTNTGELLKTIDLGEYMIQFMREFSEASGKPLSIRIGIHIGSVTAGVIGKTKFAFDIWGDTVNIASRMESSGIPMEIHITEEVAHYLAEHSSCVYRGEVEIKGKGRMKTYIINRRDDLSRLGRGAGGIVADVTS